jgi:hypothetical protein
MTRTYKVTFYRTTVEADSIEVDAENAEEAEKLAETLMQECNSDLFLKPEFEEVIEEYIYSVEDINNV